MHHQIKEGTYTWEDFEKADMCLPVGRRGVHTQITDDFYTRLKKL